MDPIFLSSIIFPNSAWTVDHVGQLTQTQWVQHENIFWLVATFRLETMNFLSLVWLGFYQNLSLQLSKFIFIFILSLQVSEAVDIDPTPPWWLQCNPKRFPYWSVLVQLKRCQMFVKWAANSQVWKAWPSKQKPGFCSKVSFLKLGKLQFRLSFVQVCQERDSEKKVLRSNWK